jgi:hypothetical protein
VLNLSAEDLVPLFDKVTGRGGFPKEDNQDGFRMMLHDTDAYLVDTDEGTVLVDSDGDVYGSDPIGPAEREFEALAGIDPDDEGRHVRHFMGTGESDGVFESKPTDGVVVTTHYADISNGRSHFYQTHAIDFEGDSEAVQRMADAYKHHLNQQDFQGTMEWIAKNKRRINRKTNLRGLQESLSEI